MTTTTTTTTAPTLDVDIQAALAAGNKIAAIKLYRERHGVGLREAKEAIEGLPAAGSRRTSWRTILWLVVLMGGFLIWAIGRDDAPRREKEAAERAATAEAQAQREIAQRRAIIKAGEIRVGFTAQEVDDAWGRPDTINTTGDVTEQWVYARRGYVYFAHGSVTAIQATR